MRRKWLWPALLSVLLVAGVGIGWWFNQELKDKRQMETVLGNKYQYNFYGLLSKAQNVEVLLAKGLVSSTSKQRTAVFSDLLYQSYSGQELLGQLPLEQNITTRTSKFLNQVGDYAYFLNKKLNSGGKLTTKDYNNLQKLHDRSILLNQRLSEVEAKTGKGLVTWNEIKRNTEKSDASAKSAKGLSNIVKEMTEMPSLIYDGPFSEHISKMKPKGLTGKTISKSEAIKAARKFLDFQDIRNWNVYYKGMNSGKIPSYHFELKPKNDKNRIIYTDISKKGGHVVYMLDTRPIDSPKLSLEQARNEAYNFLNNKGMPKMISTFMIAKNNIAVISFIRMQNNVAIYPDQVKVQVALDNGRIVGYEASMYLLHHVNRKIPKPSISLAKAQTIISPKLEVAKRRLTIIPTEGKNEILCWEFIGDLGNDTFFIYINAKTGMEEKILKLIKLPNGTLTM